MYNHETKIIDVDESDEESAIIYKLVLRCPTLKNEK